MEMQQVRYFNALACTLNFTRAAERCNVSQPALSRAIQALEAELGGALFHREWQRTHLTELGRLMAPYFEEIAARLTAAKSQADRIARLRGGPLRVGVMHTVGPGVISGLVARYGAAFPEVGVRMTGHTAAELVDALIAGDLSVAILGVSGELDLRFHSLRLFEERFVVALPKNHRLAEHNVVRAKDLHREAYIDQGSCEHRDIVRAKLAERGVELRTVSSIGRDDWVQSLVRLGLGVGLLPEFCQLDPELVIRRLIDPEVVRNVHLVTVRGRPHSPAVGAFVGQARGYAWPGTAAGRDD